MVATKPFVAYVLKKTPKNRRYQLPNLYPYKPSSITLKVCSVAQDLKCFDILQRGREAHVSVCAQKYESGYLYTTGMLQNNSLLLVVTYSSGNSISSSSSSSSSSSRPIVVGIRR